MKLNNKFTELINSMTDRQLLLLIVMMIKSTNYELFEDDIFLKNMIKLGELIKKV